jgi:glucose/arabinose dehydrogenase
LSSIVDAMTRHEDHYNCGMTPRLAFSCVAAVATLLAVQPFVIAQGQGPAKGPASPGPFFFDTGTGQRIKVSLVADGLVHPFGMVFPDARTILVTERAGRLRVIRDGKLLPKPAWEAPDPPAGVDERCTDRLHGDPSWLAIG